MERPKWVEEENEKYFDSVFRKESDGSYWVFVGIAEDTEDYYYALCSSSDSSNLIYLSCVCSPEMHGYIEQETY